MVLLIVVWMRKPSLISSPNLEKRPKTICLSGINLSISDIARLKSMSTSTYAFEPRLS